MGPRPKRGYAGYSPRTLALAVTAVKVGTLLHGYRCAHVSDLPAARELLPRLSRMIDDLPEIIELDFNPVLVRRAGGGALVLDAGIRVSRPIT